MDVGTVLEGSGPFQKFLGGIPETVDEECSRRGVSIVSELYESERVVMSRRDGVERRRDGAICRDDRWSCMSRLLELYEMDS